MAYYYTCMQNEGHSEAGFSLRCLYKFSWASLSSQLYKKTKADAVAEYLRSFTFVIVTEMEGEFLKDLFFFLNQK